MSDINAAVGVRPRTLVVGTVLAIVLALAAGTGLARAAMPVANDVFAGTNDVTPVLVHFNASDPDSDPLTYAIADQPSGGTLGAIDQGAGTVQYTANADFAGIDTFTYTASDGTAVSEPAVATVTVRPDTVIDTGPTGLTNDRTPTFTFSSPQSDMVFQCRVNGDNWSSCASPWNAPTLADGQHTVHVRARAGTGGPFDASPATATFRVDATAPEVNLERAPGQADPTNDPMISFELEADEDLDPATVTSDDFDVTNGDIDSVTGSGKTYVITVDAADQGPVAIAPSDDFEVADPAGNTVDSAGGTERSVTYDSVAPELTLERSSGQADPARNNPIEFSLSADEPLDESSVDASDFEITNGSIDSITPASNGEELVIAVNPDDQGGVTIEPSATFEAADLAGNATDSADGTERTVTYDSLPPVVVLERAASQVDPSVDPEVEFSLTADEPLDENTVTEEDFMVINGTIDSVTGSADEWIIAVTADEEGAVTIAESGDFEVADLAGNTTDSADGTDRSVTYDRPPVLTLEKAQSQPALTNDPNIEFTLSANENLDPASVEVSDFDVTRGTVDSVNGSGDTYTIIVTANAQGDVEISESATFEVTDLTGNPTTEAVHGTERTVVYDSVPPVAEILTHPADPSLDRTPTFTFDSHESGSTYRCAIWKDGDSAPAPSACESPYTADLLDPGHKYHFTVRAIDEAGNVGLDDTYSWDLDQHGITAGAETDPYFTRGGQPVLISVIAEDSAAGPLTFTQVSGGDGTVGSFEVEGDTASALFTANDGFAGFGAITIRVRNTDTGASADVTVNVVVRPETRLLTGPGVGLTPGLTNTAFPTFTYTAVSGPNDGVVSGVAYSCKLDGVSLPDVSCAGGTFTPNTPLADGDHSFEVAAKKPGSNLDPQAQRVDFTIDTVDPEVPELDGPQGLTNDPDLIYNYTLPEGDAECRLDDGSDPAFNLCDASPVEYLNVADGEYTFEIRTIDAAGNRSPVVSRTVTVDTVVNAAFDQAPADPNRTGRPAIEVSSDEDPGVDYSYRLYIDGTDPDELPEFEATGAAFQLPLLDRNARYVLEVKAVDEAGNETVISTDWEQENTAPVAPSPSYILEAGTSEEIDLGSTDADGDDLEYEIKEVTGGTLGAVDGDGKASYQADADEVGSHTIDFEVSDGREDGTVASSVNLTILPDTVLTEEPAAITNDQRPVWKFASTAESVENFECSLDGDAWEACDDGEFTPPADLAAGDHSLEVRAVFGALVDPTPARSEIHIDLDAPDVEIDVDTAPAALSNETEPAFEFSSSDPTATFECDVDESGDWTECESGDPLDELSDGTHKFEVRAVDPAGNIGTPDEYIWEVDATDPEIELTSGPAEDAWSNARRPVWEFDATDLNLDEASITCQVDAQPEVDGCLSPWQPASNLNDGQHTVTFTAADNAGNVKTVSWTFRVTTITPTVVIDEGPDSPSGPNAAFKFSSTTNLGDNGGFECRTRHNGGAWTAWDDCDANLQLENLATGSHSIQVRAVDSAGNHSTGAAVGSWSWNTIGGVPDTALTAKNLNRGTAAFGFNSPGNPLATFECRIDGGAWSACTSPKSYSGLAAGEHTFQVRATNQVGTTDASPAEHVWTVEALVAPETMIDRRPAAETTATTAGFEFSSSEAVATFECRLDEGGWEPCTSPKEYSGLAVGKHSVEVRATSQDGLTDATPARAEWTIVAESVDAGDPQVCNPIKAKAVRGANVKLGKRLKVRVKLSHRQAVSGQIVTAQLLVNGKPPKGKQKRALRKALKLVEISSQGAVVAQLKGGKWLGKFTAADDTARTLRVVLKRKKGKALRTTVPFTLRSCGK